MSTPITDISIQKLLSTEITGNELIPVDDGTGAEAQAISTDVLKEFVQFDLLYPDVEFTSLNSDGNPLTFTSNGVNYTCTYISSGASIGKISTVVDANWTQTFNYDANGVFESKVSTPTV